AQRGGARARAGRRRLLLCRPAARPRRCDLAVNRDRLLLLLRLGGARRLQAGQPEHGTDLEARPPRRPRAEGRRLAARACPLRQTATSTGASVSIRRSNGSAPASPTSTP